jgi:DNA-directed RNA polymerase specialized sigma subunit
VKTAHETLIDQIRQSIQALIEEYTDSSSRDKKMVEQVKFLDESITKLTEELGRKVTIDELSVYMGMTEEEINDILRLTGEEPEEHQEVTEEGK